MVTSGRRYGRFQNILDDRHGIKKQGPSKFNFKKKIFPSSPGLFAPYYPAKLNNFGVRQYFSIRST